MGNDRGNLSKNEENQQQNGSPERRDDRETSGEAPNSRNGQATGASSTHDEDLQPSRGNRPEHLPDLSTKPSSQNEKSFRLDGFFSVPETKVRVNNENSTILNEKEVDFHIQEMESLMVAHAEKSTIRYDDVFEELEVESEFEDIILSEEQETTTETEEVEIDYGEKENFQEESVTERAEILEEEVEIPENKYQEKMQTTVVSEAVKIVETVRKVKYSDFARENVTSNPNFQDRDFPLYNNKDGENYVLFFAKNSQGTVVWNALRENGADTPILAQIYEDSTFKVFDDNFPLLAENYLKQSATHFYPMTIEFMDIYSHDDKIMLDYLFRGKTYSNVIQKKPDGTHFVT